MRKLIQRLGVMATRLSKSKRFWLYTISVVVILSAAITGTLARQNIDMVIDSHRRAGYTEGWFEGRAYGFKQGTVQGHIVGYAQGYHDARINYYNQLRPYIADPYHDAALIFEAKYPDFDIARFGVADDILILAIVLPPAEFPEGFDTDEFLYDVHQLYVKMYAGESNTIIWFLIYEASDYGYWALHGSQYDGPLFIEKGFVGPEAKEIPLLLWPIKVGDDFLYWLGT